jgi:hypothetical protein
MPYFLGGLEHIAVKIKCFEVGKLRKQEELFVNNEYPFKNLYFIITWTLKKTIKEIEDKFYRLKHHNYSLNPVLSLGNTIIFFIIYHLSIQIQFFSADALLK